LKQRVLQLRDQLNFYFGDSNLIKDKFLQTELKKSPLVSLDIFTKFNRVQALFQGLDTQQQISLMQ
jgi:hypothetical protein